MIDQSYSAEELLELYSINDEDLARVRKFGDRVQPHLQDLLVTWYEWLKGRPEFEQFFSDSQELERVQGLQLASWQQFFEGRVDDEYVESRRRNGAAHARIGLSLNIYFAGMNHFLEVFDEFIAGTKMSDEERRAALWSTTKLAHLDAAVVVDTYSTIVQDTITAQARSLMEMSTPVTQIWSGILLLPVVGLIDSHRAGDIMNATLAKISESHAKIFILDISGVGVVDTAVANNLIKITRATLLMGCECTISGISPAIAQTVVDLGIDVGDIKTTATMQDALADAFDRVGMDITQSR